MKNTNNSIHTSFMGNYFCLMENYQAAFVAISKNAVTSLKNIVIYSREHSIPPTEDQTHRYIGFTPDKGFLIPVSEMPFYEESHGKLLKFAVWRDPVERLISTYKWFILEKNPRVYFNWIDLYEDTSFERFVEFAIFELNKRRPIAQDEHIRKQFDYYSPSDVDVIVPIQYLNHFLKEHQIPALEEKSNESHKYRVEIGNETIDKIRELYQEDYRLFGKAENIYQPG